MVFTVDLPPPAEWGAAGWALAYCALAWLVLAPVLLRLTQTRPGLFGNKYPMMRDDIVPTGLLAPISVPILLLWMLSTVAWPAAARFFGGPDPGGKK